MSPAAPALRLLPVVAAAFVFLIGLAETDLWAPDEPRYAQIADELLGFEHGPKGLILLHLNGEPYTQKPPLYYWLAAAAGVPMGRVSELAARLPSALAAIGVIALTVWLGAAMGRARCGVLGAWILLSLMRFAHQARRAQLDLLLTAACTAALALFWHADKRLRHGTPVSRSTIVLLHGAVALATLTKGPVGLLPYAVILAYLGWEGRLRDTRHFVPLWGVAIGCGPALAWIAAAVALAPQGFFEAAVVDNVLNRYFTGTAHVRPFYYYAYQFPLDFLPWTPALLLALPSAFREGRRATTNDTHARSGVRFLLAWLLTLLVFFSLSTGKRGLYLLPAFPAAALLCGAALDRALAEGRSFRGLVAGPVCALAILTLCGGLLALAPERFEQMLSISPGLQAAGGPLSLICVAGLCALAITARRSAPRGASLVALFIGLMAVEVFFFTRVLPSLDAMKSPRPIAAAAAAITGPDETIAVYRHDAFAGGLAYYSGRRAIALESPAAVRAFVARGGRAIVVKQRDRAALGRSVPSAIRASSRTGRRRIWLLEAFAARQGTGSKPRASAPHVRISAQVSAPSPRIRFGFSPGTYR